MGGGHRRWYPFLRSGILVARAGPGLASLIISVLSFAISAVAVFIAFQQAKFAKSQLELATAKFSQIELPSVQATLRSQMEIELLPTGVASIAQLNQGRFLVRLRNKSGEEITDLSMSLRLRLQDRKTGEFEEREVASDILSTLDPGPTAFTIDLTSPARYSIREFTLRLIPTHLPKTIVLYAEWRAKSGQLVDMRKGYPLSRRRIL